MIQLFEEDYNLVKRAVTIGTDINSASDPTTGYYDGNLYINSNTLDIWETDGIVWTKKGNLKGITDITEVTNPDDGGLNVINVLLTDGTTKTFTVKNGQKGKDGKDGVDGTDGKDGADGKSIANISLASTSGNVKTYDVLLDDGTKTPTGFSVEDGASSYLHIRFSSSFDGTGMVTTPTDATVYIGILVSTSSVAPTNPSLYNWVRFIGKSGTGSGDMLSTDYATKYPNTVDKAAALYDGTDEILANQLMKKSQYDADNDGVVDNAKRAVNANKVGNANTSLLEKLSDNSGKLNYNGNALMLEAAQLANQAKLGEFVVNQKSNNVKELALHSDITTKLSKVDTPDNLSVELAKKIDKPVSATDGQVLTYNGTSNEWEAQDSKGGSITEPTDLEKGIIGGDEWVAQSYTKGATVIYNNKIYYCKADCSASNLPSEPDSNYWEETSISKLKVAINEIKMDLLWTSPNHLVAFNPQIVNVDLTNYDYVGLVLANNTSSVIITSSMLIIRKTTEIQAVGGLAIGGNCWNRIINSVTNNGIDFDRASNGAIDNNTNALPYKIYGIKY